jgi:4-amino-4-deoxy-L-arabinose transferase-like glycosyltransferase
MNKLEKVLSSRWTPRIILTVLLAFALARMVASAKVESPTNDEPANLPSGYVYLRRGNYIDSTQPPLLRYWVSLPLFILHPNDFPNDPSWYIDWRLFGRRFIYHNRVASEEIIFWPRLMVMLLTLGLGLLIGQWSRNRYGVWAGILAVSLFSLDPNMLAHGHYVTNDMAVTLACFAAVYLFWLYLKEPSWPRLFAAALVFACAQITKFSAVLLMPTLLIISGLVYWYRRKKSSLLKSPSRTQIPFWLAAAVYVGVTVLVILVAYRFEVRTLAEEKQLRVMKWANPIQNVIHKIAPELGTTAEKILTAPIPAYNYIKGLGLQIFHSMAQSMWTDAEFYQYVLGKYSRNGWWWYFPFAFIVKTPLVVMLVLGISAVLGVMGIRHSPSAESSDSERMWYVNERQEELFCLIVPVVVFMGMYITSTINIGHRYLLPIYPFLYVLASRIAAPWPRFKSAYVPAFVSGLSVLAVLPGSLLIHPHYVSYFNELIGPSNGYKYLAESNVDWGQDLLQLKQYLEDKKVDVVYIDTPGTVKPEDLGIRYKKLPEDKPPSDPHYLVAVSVNQLLAKNARRPNGLYPWLRNETPIHRIGYSIFVYEFWTIPSGAP